MTPSQLSTLSAEFKLPSSSVSAVIRLLDEGSSIPFIARYRKEATGNLDEVQIKNIQERYAYLRELEERRQSIISSIESQGKLTDELRLQIEKCETKSLLEDLYLPYKPKRRNRAAIAREKGLEPLADLIIKQPLDGDPMSAALTYVSVEKEVTDGEAALAYARDIVAEQLADHVEVRSVVRNAFASEGIIISKVMKDKEGEATKFEQYYDFKEPVRTIPSHRYLAIRRGEREEVLTFSIEIDEEPVFRQIDKNVGLNPASPFSGQLKASIDDAFHRLICPSIETEVRLDLKWIADKSAVAIFADNLRHLLLASPLGGRPVLGIDPGMRTGCKCAVIDSNGKFLESDVIYLVGSAQAKLQAQSVIKRLLETHRPYAIAIGNGTGGRETEAFIRNALKELKWEDSIVVPVNEAGASVYSASDIAREEFPELDLTIRGAISIARRLQDPLAELVKIDPKSIGVGQYQHDVHQPLLQSELQHVVASCVNQVGVDINTASASLLSYVSGIGPALARKIVKYREATGSFRTRQAFREIPGFGAKTFEQAAGFLRILQAENPLDSSAVHPERYELVEQMAKDLQAPLKHLMNNHNLIHAIELSKYKHLAGEHTLADIIEELKKPGRDPRATFEPPTFRDDVLTIEDLKVGMRLQGVVTNVTAFGAFVDVGVHQDGLIHLSELSNRFIKHPSEVVKTGDKVNIEVLLVDVTRRRIALTARVGEKRPSDHEKNPSEVAQKSKRKQTSGNFFSNPFSAI